MEFIGKTTKFMEIFELYDKYEKMGRNEGQQRWKIVKIWKMRKCEDMKIMKT